MLAAHEVAEAALRAGYGSAKDLRLSWARRYGIRIPRRAVCPGHSAPMDAIWRAYSGQDRKAIWLANRGGGKTNGLGYLEAAECEHRGVSVSHVAATLDQGSRMQTYASRYVQSYPDILAPGNSDIKQKIRFRNGAQLEILPATIKGTNGPHTPKVSLDEADLIAWPVIQQAFSIPLGTEQDPAAFRIVSTRKYATGSMQKLIETAAERDFAVHTWCLWETIAPCQRDSCGECARKASHDRLGARHTFAEACDGKARRSDGYIALQDAWDAFTSLDWETFDAEWLCNRPESIGQYYQHFQRPIHCVTAEQTDWRPEHGRGILVGIDYGVADPNAMIVGIAAGPESDPWARLVLVDSLEDGDGDTIAITWPRMWAMVESYRKRFVDRRARERVEWWGDPEGRNRQHGAMPPVRQIRDLSGCKVRVRSSKRLVSFEARHSAVENRLRLRSDGEPTLYLLSETKGACDLARSMESLRRKLDRDGQPTGEGFVHDENSHKCSALEFALVGLDTIVRRGRGDLEDGEVRA